MNSLTLHYHAQHVSQRTIDRFIKRLRPGTMEIVDWRTYSRLWFSTLAPGPKLYGLHPCQPAHTFSAGHADGGFVV